MSRGLYRGWIVVIAAFIAMTVVFGVAYSFAAFFSAFEQDFAANRADVSLVFGLASLLYFGLGAFGGAASDRWGPGPVAIIGMVLVTIGLAAASFAQSLIGVYAGYGIGVGLGIALVYTPAMGAVQPWFIRHRGLASGIASAGIGMGTLLVPLAVSALIDAVDWRLAMQALAVMTLIAGVAAASRLERDPARHGLAPDGLPLAYDAATGLRRPSSESAGFSLGQILRMRSFRWMYLSIVLSGMPMFVPFAHLSASARDAGMDSAQAVSLVGIIGIGSLLGRFGVGSLADRFGRLRTRVIVELVLGASMLIWMLAQTSGSPSAFVLFALLFGFTYGGIVSLLPPIMTDLYGTRAVAGAIGVLYSGAAFGALIGPVLAGAAFDRYGSYSAAMLIGMLCSASAAALAWSVARSNERASTQ